MNLKYLHFLLLFFGVIGLTNCSSKKYISEVPYRYSSEEEYQAISTEKTAIENQYTNVDDNPEKLDDKKLRLKEKYAVLFGVMPKEIKNYDFYAYIDPCLGTPYRKQTLELQKAVDCSFFVLFSKRPLLKPLMEFSVPTHCSFLQEELFYKKEI